MAQASVNRVTYRTVREATPGTTPASPVFRSVRFTQGGPAGTPQFVESGEVVSDRMTNDIVYVGKEIGGDLGGELAYEMAPDFVDSAMCNTRLQTMNRVGSTQITQITSPNYTVSTQSGGNGIPRQYMLVKATGFANAANNRIFVAQTGSNATTVVAPAPALASETPSGQNVRVKCIGLEGPTAEITATATGLGRAASLIDYSNFGLSVGQWVKVGGNATANQFATAANNGWCRISAIVASALTFDVVPTGFTTDAGTGKNIRVYFGDYIYGGTTVVTNTVERDFGDIARYEYFAGVVTNTMSVQLTAKQIATVSFGFLGMGHTSPSASRFASAASRDGIVAPIINAASHVAQMRDNGTAIAGPNYITGLTISLSNNGETLPYVGSTDFAGVNIGEQKIEGQIQAYFGDETLLARVYAGTTVSLDIALLAPDGSGYLHGYIFDLPKIKYAGGNPEVGAKNSVVQQTIPFRALKAEPVGGGTKYAMSISHFESVGA